MKKYLLVGTALVSAYVFQVNTASAKGLLDFMDPCKKAEAEFETIRNDAFASADKRVSQLAAWYETPTTLPNEIENEYRNLAKKIAFRAWRDASNGKAIIASWRAQDPDTDIESAFFEHIYTAEISDQDEEQIAHQLYKLDYENTIKPKLEESYSELRQNIAEKQAELDESCSPDVISQILRATIGRAIMTVEANFEASKNEKGDIAAFVRATSGISLTDIAKYGLRGGPNSEANKLRVTWTTALEDAGIGKNHFLRELGRALDPTNLNMPDELKVTVDDSSLENLTTNLTLGIVKDGKINENLKVTVDDRSAENLVTNLTLGAIKIEF